MLGRMEIGRLMEPLRRDLDVLIARRTLIEGDVNAVRARMEAVQRMCGHPHKHETSTMGDVGWRCPDCGAGA